jgi:TolB-like protein/Tfp pilus assembly protein PilF
MNGLSVKGIVHELRRRHTFRTGGLYIVGAWLVMQVADVFFPVWGLPDAAINVLLATAILAFPIALVFGWFFDITADGIVRTPQAGSDDRQTPLPLQRRDYVLLGALVLIAAYIVYDGVQDIVQAPRVAETEQFPEQALPDRTDNSIAVLPFANTSNDPDNEAFCDGVSEEILHKLSLYDELRVIGRTSSFAFKGSDYRIPRIAALLGVRYVLQGSVRRDGNKLRVLASLVDETGAQKWSDSFDRELESVFEIQAEIADVVAATVVPKIIPVQHEDYEPDPAAYQQYLIGRDMLWKRDLRAADALEAATELDPNFAAAHAELAVALLIRSPPYDRAKTALETALALEPGLPRALAARGLLLWGQSPPDPAGAERVFREALARNPSDVDALNWLSILMREQGNVEESLTLMERAARIDPLHGVVVSNLALKYIRRGDHDRAEAMLLRMLEVPTPSRGAFDALRILYLNTGRLAEMNTMAKRQAAQTGTILGADLAWSYAVLGLWDSAAYWANLLRKDFPDIGTIAIGWSLLASWQGKYDEAVQRYPRDTDSPPFPYIHGEMQALAGDFDGAVATLAPLRQQAKGDYGHQQVSSFHALAWVYLETGREQEALSILEEIERQFAQYAAMGQLHVSEDLFYHAQNALLRGNRTEALDRLEKAIDAGWRKSAIRRHDPRWAALKDDPRYIELMQRVEEDVERQRAEVERIDAEEDFIALFEATRRLRQ